MSNFDRKEHCKKIAKLPRAKIQGSRVTLTIPNELLEKLPDMPSRRSKKILEILAEYYQRLQR